MIKKLFYFRCKTTHEWHPGLRVEAGTFVGKGGVKGVSFDRAQLFTESSLEKNIDMYFPGEHWEVVKVELDENDLVPFKN